ncbi:MAG: HAD family hydrolase [Flavobacteriaceae bacterium]
MFEHIKTIAFDADDTLWVNETYFRDTEEHFGELLAGFETPNQIQQELFKTEIENLKDYGYGIKGFVLSMIECGINLSNGELTASQTQKIIDFGKEMLNHPVELLPGVERVLSTLYGRYKLLLVTKGDLLDQERKLEKSGLAKYFSQVRVLSDKQEKDYQNLLDGMGTDPKEFLMIGNSLKSDVLPLVNIGASAVHIPFHTTWAHEEAEPKEHQDYLSLNELGDIIPYFED